MHTPNRIRFYRLINTKTISSITRAATRLRDEFMEKDCWELAQDFERNRRQAIYADKTHALSVTICKE